MIAIIYKNINIDNNNIYNNVNNNNNNSFTSIYIKTLLYIVILNTYHLLKFVKKKCSSIL